MNIQCLKYEKLVETERRTDHTNAICSSGLKLRQEMRWG